MHPVTRHWRAQRFSFATWLTLISLLSLLPMLGFSVFVVQRLLAANQTQEIVALQGRAAQAAVAVGRELERTRTAGHVIALSGVAVRGDFEGLHALTRRVVDADPAIRSIALHARDGRRVLVTSQPWDPGRDASVARRLPDGAARAVDDETAVVSALEPAEADDTPAFRVVQPLQVTGGERYALSLVVEPASITAVLAGLRLPADWTATVADEQLRIVARSRDAARFLGQPVTESLAARIRQGHDGDTFSALTKEGVRLVGAVAPVPGSAWWVAMGLPEAELQARARQPLLWVGAAGLMLLVLCAGAAGWLGRELTRQVGQAARGEPERAWTVLELQHLRQRDLRAARALEDARHDALTGLPARALFDQQVRQRVAEVNGRAGWGLAALFIDLDGFKAVNDRLGHEAGDRLLADVADSLRRCTRADDLLARLGGDEFAVLLSAPEAQLQDISQGVAARIVDDIPRLSRDPVGGVGCSIGIAVGAGDADVKALFDQADQAMLAAKRAGRGRVVVWGEASARAGEPSPA